MPHISFWTIFILFGIVSEWAQKATEDGKITLTEAAELAEALGPVLGIPVSIEVDLTRRVSELGVESEETESAAVETAEDKPTTDTSPHKEILL